MKFYPLTTLDLFHEILLLMIRNLQAGFGLEMNGISAEMKSFLKFLTSLSNFQRQVQFNQVRFATSKNLIETDGEDLYIFKDEINIEEYKNFIFGLLIQKFSIEEKYHFELDKKLRAAINEHFSLLQRN